MKIKRNAAGNSSNYFDWNHRKWKWREKEQMPFAYIAVMYTFHLWHITNNNRYQQVNERCTVHYFIPNFPCANANESTFWPIFNVSAWCRTQTQTFLRVLWEFEVTTDGAMKANESQTIKILLIAVNCSMYEYA